MSLHNHHLKRLKHSKHSFDSRTPSLNDESIQNFAITCNTLTKLFQSVFVCIRYFKKKLILSFSLNQLLIEHDVVVDEHMIVIGVHQHHYQNEQLIMI